MFKIEIFKLNKRLNKFYLFCKYWKGKIRSRLNGIFFVSISFLINIGKEMSLPGLRIHQFKFFRLAYFFLSKIDKLFYLD